VEEKGQTGRWRQDDLEPRIVLDGNGEFFAIGISGPAAARIVVSLNRTEVDGARSRAPTLEQRGRAMGPESGH
jgi:hypothetical protein